MKGQFYIISVTVIIVMATAMMSTLQSVNPNLFQPISDGAGFQAYNFQRAAIDLTRTVQTIMSSSARGGVAGEILSNFTAESASFAEKNGMKLSWDYSILKIEAQNTTIRYNMSFESERMSMKDSFTVTRLAKWRQRVNITTAAALPNNQVTIRLNFTQNRVSNCSREITVHRQQSQKPANVTYAEYSKFTGWRYQVPIIIYAGAYNRTDALLEPYIDFASQLKSLPAASLYFDNSSVRVVEYDEAGLFIQEVPSQFTPGPGYYQTNASGKVLWIMNGSTPPGTSRYYSILFDTNDSGNKPPPNYNTDLAVTDNMTGGCYIEISNSKVRYRILKGGCENDEGNAGGLKNAWIVGGSGHDLIDAADNYGQYFNTSTESGPITYYNISEGNVSRRIVYQATGGFNVNITAYSTVPYYKMDIYTGSPSNSEFSPATEHHGAALCDYRNDSTHKWAEVYSPFWNGEGYGIVGLNASVTELQNPAYSCSRIRHKVNGMQNWTIYTLFRTPKFTAEDLYLERSSPPNITIGTAQPYSGYCTSANITFLVSIPAGSYEYEVQYGHTNNTMPNTGAPDAPVSYTTLPEEDISEITVY